MNNLKQKIIELVNYTHEKPVQIEKIYSSEKPIKKNQLLFFIKPEITQNIPSIKLDKVLDIIFTKINDFSFDITDVRLLGASYLKRYDVISQHYGVINQLSRKGYSKLGEDSLNKFKEIYHESIAEDKVYGSLELLDKYQDFTVETLTEKWRGVENHKLGGGTYVAQIEYKNALLYVINGFHPLQLENFMKPGRSIIAFTLTTDTDWKTARNEFIGATNPEFANNGSLRRLLYDNMNELGLPEINGSKNGVHLSAGPIEALVELIRFNSDLSKNIKHEVTDFRFGKLLKESFTDNQIAQILSNSDVIYNQHKTSVFDLTEEKNSQEAINILREAKF